MQKGDADARHCAMLALVHTLDNGQPLDGFWQKEPAFEALTPPDRAFTQHMVKTTLRHLGQIDAILQQFIDKPLKKHGLRVQHIMRLAVAQLLWLQTPPHAAVHSAVDLVKKLKLTIYSGLVNAVLKKIVLQGADLMQKQPAATLNTPAWLWQSLVKAYGRKNAEGITLAHAQEPPVDITVKSNSSHWANALGGMVLPNGSVRLQHAGVITQLEGFEQGEWWVQDVSASLPVTLFSSLKDKRVLDMCAAPGGKTAQLIMAGAEVIALDASPARLHTLKGNLQRLQLKAECIAIDALVYKTNKLFDAILLDAPCSATGILRRHPDVAWNRKKEEIERLAATQAELLNHAIGLLKPGGELIYCVCSLQPEEGEKQIERLILENNNINIIKSSLSFLPDSAYSSGIRILPHYLMAQGGMDGFFMCLIRKG